MRVLIFKKINGYYYIFLIHSGRGTGRNSGYAGWKVVCNAVSGFRSSWTDSYSASGYLEGSFSGFWTERTCAGRNRGSQYQTGYIYQPLVEVMISVMGCFPRWQFNHDPDPRYYHLDALQGTYTITTREVCTELTQAVNTLTQRMSYPSCAAEVTVDASALKRAMSQVCVRCRAVMLQLALQNIMENSPYAG